MLFCHPAIFSVVLEFLEWVVYFQFAYDIGIVDVNGRAEDFLCFYIENERLKKCTKMQNYHG